MIFGDFHEISRFFEVGDSGNRSPASVLLRDVAGVLDEFHVVMRIRLKNAEAPSCPCGADSSSISCKR